MNRTEFQALVDEHLTGAWGDRAFPPVVIARLWALVSVVSAGDFKGALDNVLLTSTRAPNLGQIKAALLPCLQRAWDDQRAARIKSLPDCVWCSKGGWVFVIPFEDPTAEGAFVCTKCEAAKVRGITTSRGAQCWEDRFEKKFFVRRFTTDAAIEAMQLQDVGYQRLRKVEQVRREIREHDANEKQRAEERQVEAVGAGCDSHQGAVLDEVDVQAGW